MAYDLSGSDPLYSVGPEFYMIHEDNQVIELYEPIFADSLEVRLENGTLLDLSPAGNSDYEIRDEDEDDMGISEAKLINSSFNEPLIKSFRVIKTYSTDYKIKISYQKLRSGAILSQIADTLNLVDLKQRDLTGVNPDNLIIDELHAVDTTHGISVVRPGYGAFYEHDVVVKVEGSSTALVKGTDYIIMGNNLPKTRVTTHTSGVYDYIYVIADITNNLEVTYRAFGGETNYADYNYLKTAMIDMAEFLNSNSFMTDQNLPTNGFIIDMNGRIVELEDWRMALDSSAPSLNIEIEHSNNVMQWHTIATLWKSKIDYNIVNKDSAGLRIKLKDNDIIMDVSLTINTKNPNDMLDVVSIITSGHNENISTTDYRELKEAIIPQLRILSIDGDSDNNYGVVLQLGVSLKGSMPPNATEELIIENHSAGSSELYLKDTVTGIVSPENNNVVMPDSNETWVDGTDVKVNKVLGQDDGVLIWAGGCLLHEIRDISNELTLTTMMDVNNFSASEVDGMTFVIHDRHSGKTIRVNSDQLDSYPSYHGIVYLLDMVALHCEFDGINLKIYTSEGGDSMINERFILQQIYATFNLTD